MTATLWERCCGKPKPLPDGPLNALMWTKAIGDTIADKPKHVFRSGQKRGVQGRIKRELRRRSAMEAVIGHLKSDGHMGRNFLKGREGDPTNVVLTAVGYNFSLILKWIRRLCAKIILMINAFIAPGLTPRSKPAVAV